MLAGLNAHEAGVAATKLNKAITASTPAELARFHIHRLMLQFQDTAGDDGSVALHNACITSGSDHAITSSQLCNESSGAHICRGVRRQASSRRLSSYQRWFGVSKKGCAGDGVGTSQQLLAARACLIRSEVVLRCHRHDGRNRTPHELFKRIRHALMHPETQKGLRTSLFCLTRQRKQTRPEKGPETP